LAGKGCQGPAGQKKRVSEAPDRLGESSQFGFALANGSGTTIERWWCVDQDGKGARPSRSAASKAARTKGSRIKDERFVVRCALARDIGSTPVA
jgi:hypothetical protein